MKVYATIDDPRMPLVRVAEHARRAERIGFDGLLIPEAVHDGFLTALMALEHTERLTVTTSVVLAFPRSPMVTAYAAWDLQELSGGRFHLGLGSQVKGNIEGRYSVPWTPPVPRMRDYVGSLRAIWNTWRTGAPLAFESENYRFTRMQPFFAPNAPPGPEVPVLLGGVNPHMMALAGEAADGLMTHPTNTSPRYLRERVWPAIERGAARSGRDPHEVQLIASTFAATGPDAEAVARERERILQFLGFLYSTPHYWPTLELYGWGEVGRRLHEMSREGRWGEMPGLITGEMFDALVPSGTYDEIGATLLAWYGEVAQAITLRMPEDAGDDETLGGLIRQLQQG